MARKTGAGEVPLAGLPTVDLGFQLAVRKSG